MMAEILEGTLNSRVAPRRIFVGHAHDELPNLGEDTAAAGSSPRIRPLARHQLPVPSQERVRGDDCRHVAQRCSTQPVRPYGESPPVAVCQPQATAADLPAQEAILFNELGHCLPFPAIEPASDSEEQQLKNRDVDHERELISRTRQRCPQSCRS